MGRPIEFDESDIRLMRHLRNDGMTLIEIAKKFDCSGATVWSKTRDSLKEKLTVSRLKSDSLDGMPPTEDQPLYCKGEIIGYFVTTKTWGEI